MKTNHRLLALLLVSSGAFALPVQAQSSIGSRIPITGANVVLRDGTIELIHHRNTSWTLKNMAATSGDAVTWVISVRRKDTTPDILTVNGFIRVQNSGTVSATIGNIVLNLQRKVGDDWISAAANCANAAFGDAATSCLIVKAASREEPPLNLTLGPNNYTTNGAAGLFTESAGSGELRFTDADTNTTFSLVPQKILSPGATVNLLFTAEFNNTVLGLPVDFPAGVGVRAEVLVSFGNAGLRSLGGSAVAIDINGDGVIGVDEERVKTVASRVDRCVPELQIANDSVTLRSTDVLTDIFATGTITWANLSTTIGGGSGVEVTSGDINRLVSLTVTGNEGPGSSSDGNGSGGSGGGSTGGFEISLLGGIILNESHLSAPGTAPIVVNGAIDPVTGLPSFSYTFLGLSGTDLQACDTVDFSNGNGPGYPDCVYCTFTQGGWGANPSGHNAGVLLEDNFPTVYPSGVEVGIPGGGGFSMLFTTSAAVNAYLPAGGPAGALNADLVDPTSSSAGVFGGQVLALQINVDFSYADIPHENNPPFGDAYLCNTGTSLDGMTISQVLAAANTALGGGVLPSGFTISTLNALITDLNESNDNCSASTWGQEHLCRNL